MNENRSYLAQRVGDILNALQDLNQNSDGMGARQLVSNAQTIANQMRRIIHTHWPDEEEENLKTLQKCGVAILKTVEEKGDLKSVLSSCQDLLEKMTGSSESPVNEIVPEQDA